MKNKVVIILILLTRLTFGQSVKTITIGGTRPDKLTDLKILLGCGFAGTTSSQFNSTHTLIYSKNYKALLKNLRSTDLFTQLLSAIAVEELNKRNQLVMTPKDIEIISKLKSSYKTYYCCSGCTGHYYGKIAEIFKPDPNNYNDILSILRLKIGLDKYEVTKK